MIRPAFSLSCGESAFLSSEHTPQGDCYAPLDTLSIRAPFREYPEFDAVEWTLQLSNEGDSDSPVICQLWDADLLLPLSIPPAQHPGYLPDEDRPCVTAMNGMVKGRYYSLSDPISATEYTFSHDYLEKYPQQTKCYRNLGARSSEELVPFFRVSSQGEGYLAAIGWSGSWKAQFSLEKQGIRFKAGLQNAHFFLYPKERVRTCSVLIMKYAKGEDFSNKFRRLLHKHLSHTACNQGAKRSLLAFELWGGLPSEEMKRRIALLKEYAIPFEELWIDAGWYGDCLNCTDAFAGDWGKHTGDWTLNPHVHPQGMTDVAACAHRAGMSMMLWLEPERARQGTPIPKEHPDWFLSLPDNKELLLNYGNEEAWQYAFDTLCFYVEKYKMGCYRQDFNIRIDRYFAAADRPDRQGISEIRHITGLYRLWDALHERYPHLLIDNCASGGRRLDMETLKRSILFFRSDYQCNFNENPDVLQVHNTNSSQYFPLMGCTTKTVGDRYAARSSYAPSWGGAFFSAIFQPMEAKDLAFVKETLTEYLRIRPYLCEDFFNHGSSVLDDSSWAIWQYHDPQTQKGIVMAFRRSHSPFAEAQIRLKGLPASAKLRLTDREHAAQWSSGIELSLRLPEKRSSLLWEYETE